jgi:lysophospholipase L1-like esterase
MGAGLAQFIKSSFSSTTKYIIPLGDSITFGYGQPPALVNGGYRLPLQQICRSEGRLVDMIGTQAANSDGMTDPEYEGYPGYRLDQVRDVLATRSFSVTPDVILLHIGTNDLYQNYDLANLNTRLYNWMTDIFTRWPLTRVILSRIGPFYGTYSALDALKGTYNTYITNLPGVHPSGARMQVVTMDAVLTSAMLADGLHPNSLGYQFMAWSWWNELKLVI